MPRGVGSAERASCVPDQDRLRLGAGVFRVFALCAGKYLAGTSMAVCFVLWRKGALISLVDTVPNLMIRIGMVEYWHPVLFTFSIGSGGHTMNPTVWRFEGYHVKPSR